MLGSDSYWRRVAVYSELLVQVIDGGGDRQTLTSAVIKWALVAAGQHHCPLRCPLFGEAEAATADVSGTLRRGETPSEEQLQRIKDALKPFLELRV
jgi:hypothetical protein